MSEVETRERLSTQRLMADLAPWRSGCTVVAVEHDRMHLAIRWSDGRLSRYTALWLRDNCACPQCRHPQALERTFMFIDHPPPGIASARLQVRDVLEIEFHDGGEYHLSRYSTDWLRAHDYAGRVAKKAECTPRLWDSSFGRTLTCVSFEDYMHTHVGLRTWIEALNTEGIVLMRGVPQESRKLLEVARRVGPVRASNFGDYYDVISMPNPNASAYTQLGLELHTDLANWRVPPDVQLLSCLHNSVIGGDSVFADGFRVAEDLRAAHEEAFDLLSSYPLDYRFQDDTCDIRASAPVLELDREGQLMRIRFNNWLRAAIILPEDLVEPMYSALGALWRMLREPRYRLELRLQAGDLIAYNNNRVLHGRTSFDAGSGKRHLQGCYLNQEDLDSRLRLLDRLQT